MQEKKERFKYLDFLTDLLKTHKKIFSSGSTQLYTSSIPSYHAYTERKIVLNISYFKLFS